VIRRPADGVDTISGQSMTITDENVLALTGTTFDALSGYLKCSPTLDRESG